MDLYFQRPWIVFRISEGIYVNHKFGSALQNTFSYLISLIFHSSSDSLFPKYNKNHIVLMQFKNTELNLKHYIDSMFPCWTVDTWAIDVSPFDTKEK